MLILQSLKHIIQYNKQMKIPGYKTYFTSQYQNKD